jgi:cell division protein FtsB
MANINRTVYFRERGTSKIYPLKQAKRRIGSYGVRWYEGTRQRQKIVGQYPAAVAAKLRKEVELKKARQKTNFLATPEESTKLDTAVDTFVREREDLNPDSARRWRIELDLFKEPSGKAYLQELTREDLGQVADGETFPGTPYALAPGATVGYLGLVGTQALHTACMEILAVRSSLSAA